MASYIIGIDGGGSKTAFALADKNGKCLLEVKLSRSNPADIGLENTGRLLCEGVDALLDGMKAGKSDISAIFAGIAGVCSADGYIEYLKETLSKHLPYTKVAVDSDGHNPLFAAFPESDGVAVICGTGSSCFVKVGSTISRIGGYGPFDGIGNGYEIGKAVINHALRVLDGRDASSPLSDAVLEKHGGHLIERLGEFITAGKASVAAYAPLAYACYDSDAFAKDIVDGNLAYVAELINASARFFDGGFGVALTGGIACDPLSLPILKRFCNANASLFVLQQAPVAGAVARARLLL